MEDKIRTITWEEYAKHTDRTSLWVLIDGKIYDVTSYQAEHPGGDDILLRYAGLDATNRFNEVNHTEYAKSIRDPKIVGQIEDKPMPEGYMKKLSKPRIKPLNVNQELTMLEAVRHKTREDLWIVIDGLVYDVTDFAEEHPGGSSILLSNAAKDATTNFQNVGHSQKAKDMLKQFQVGVLAEKKSSGLLKYVMFFVGLLIAILINYLKK